MAPPTDKESPQGRTRRGSGPLCLQQKKIGQDATVRVFAGHSEISRLGRDDVTVRPVKTLKTLNDVHCRNTIPIDNQYYVPATPPFQCTNASVMRSIYSPRRQGGAKHQEAKRKQGCEEREEEAANAAQDNGFGKREKTEKEKTERMEVMHQTKTVIAVQSK